MLPASRMTGKKAERHQAEVHPFSGGTLGDKLQGSDVVAGGRLLMSVSNRSRIRGVGPQSEYRPRTSLCLSSSKVFSCCPHGRLRIPDQTGH